jgi:hypothetical protein
VKAEAQAVEIGAGAHDPIVTGELPRHVDQRLGRIGGDQDHRLGCGFHQFRDDVLKHLHVGVEQAQAAGRVAAVGGAAGLFIDAGGDDRETGIGKVGVVAVADRNQGR